MSLDLHEIRRERLAEETGTIVKDAPIKVALAYPNPYPIAMSSLGYQVIYRLINDRPAMVCERFVLPDDVSAMREQGQRPISLERGRVLTDFNVIGFSVTFDLDITGVFELLDLSGIPIRRADRTDRDPLILLGGPITASNVLPFAPFVDVGVIGDGEVAVPQLMAVLEEERDRARALQRAAEIPGVWVPSLHGERVPPTQKVTEGLPAYGQIVTPRAELSNMFLVEASRGCPRHCKFCLVRAAESPMRENEIEAVMARIPPEAPRVGFVGAAISEWSGIKEALRRVVEQGKGVGISSLRADRLDAELVELLAAGGYRTMTVASDAPSQRQRAKMAKGLRTEHLERAAELARDAGMARLKMYVIVGLPGETDEDLDELISFSLRLREVLPLALGISPLIPKLHTPLGDAPFAGMPAIEHALDRIRRGVKGRVELRSVSARWAWVEYRLSQGGADAGDAALAAWRAGASFNAWKRALQDTVERGALDAARRAALWQPAGMR